MKPVSFVGNSLDAIRRFPQGARRQAGFQIDRLQRQLDPDDWKPIRTVGTGAREIRIRNTTGAYRVIYVANLGDAVYILHAFQKKSRVTPKRDVKLAADRYRELVRKLDDE